jgi:hypothetical protein
MVQVDVGFRGENPHQPGLGFRGVVWLFSWFGAE